MAARYGLAVGAWAAAWAAALALWAGIGHAQLDALMLVAVALATWRSGLGPGLLAASLAAAAHVLFPDSSGSAPAIGLDDAAFAVEAVGLLWLVGRLRIERDRSEAAGRRLGAVLDSMPAGVVFAEAPTGRLVLGNARAESILARPFAPSGGVADYPVDYPIARPDGQPYDPDEYPVTRALRGAHVIDEELWARRPDGSWAVISVNAAPIADARGERLGAVAVFLDVTARRRAEDERERLLAEAQRVRDELRAVFDATDDGVLLFDRAGRLVLANRAARALTGEIWGDPDALRDVDDLRGSLQPLEADGTPRRTLAVDDALRGQAASSLLVCSSGGFDGRRFQVNAVPVRGADVAVTGAVAVVHEITALHAAQTARAELEVALKGEMERQRLAMDLHDGAMGDLSGLAFTLEAAERTLADDDQHARSALRDAQRRVTETLGALRRYMARLETGTPRVSRECGPSDVRQAVATAVDEIRRSLGVRVALRVVGDMRGVTMLGPPEHLAFVVHEAASNSVRHGGATALTVRLARTRRGLTLTIRDDGRGFDPDAPARVGNGLRNMATRARALGGELRIGARPGSGATVRVAVDTTPPQPPHRGAS